MISEREPSAEPIPLGFGKEIIRARLNGA
jgi:hypothetical protein